MGKTYLLYQAISLKLCACSSLAIGVTVRLRNLRGLIFLYLAMELSVKNHIIRC